MIGEKALIVFSGGQDSTTCLFWAKKHFSDVEAIVFNYGQRHHIEIEAAKHIANYANVPFQVIKLDLLPEISKNSLTDLNMEVPTEKPESNPPNTLVEGRNMLFLTYAAIYAKSQKIQHLVTGVGEADFSGYPDCRNEFILSLNQTLNLSMDYAYQIHTPLMWKSKKEVWEMSHELGVLDLIRQKTVTCYNGIKGDGCGQCPACQLRNNGLQAFLKQKENG